MNIFLNDLENHSFLSSMFLCVKKIIPCLEKDNYVNLPANINKYFSINQMPIISSRYWNMVHGNNPEEVKQDEEGM